MRLVPVASLCGCASARQYSHLQLHLLVSSSSMSPSEQLWTPASLKTDKGRENVLKFTHPAREASFPDLYQLIGHHPLRPAEFTSAHFPQCTRGHFRDYVVTIRKDTDFMKSVSLRIVTT